VVLGANQEHGRRRQMFEEHSTFDLRPHDVAIHLVAEVGMGREDGLSGQLL
jgi:hypothetical protein